MAKSNRGLGKQARVTCSGKPLRSRKDTKRDRQGRDIESRIEVYKEASGEPVGFVYVIQDALGNVKVGYTKCVPTRLRALQVLVPHHRRPLTVFKAFKMSDTMARKVEIAALDALEIASHDVRQLEWVDGSAHLACKRVVEAIAAVRRARKRWPNGFSANHVRKMLAEEVGRRFRL